MTDSQQTNYDVLFKYVNIIVDGKNAISIINQVASIDIYESILSPIITCNIHIVDRQNILENIPLIMKKIFVEMEYITPRVEGGKKRRFVVNEVGNRVYDSQLKTSSFTLHCLSEEVIAHSNHVLSKVVSGEEIGKEVERIVRDELNSKKNVFIDTTKGTQKIQISNLKPFQAIDKLRQRAISLNNLSNSYLFFENHNGFNFVTLEWLVKGLPGTKDVDFYLTLGNSDRSEAGAVRNIIGYQGIVHDNTTNILASGSMYTVQKRHDIASGSIIDVTTKPDIDAFVKDTGLRGALPPNFVAENTKKPNKRIYTLHDSTLPETYNFEMPLKTFYVSLCTKHITRIYVYGDSLMACGSSLNLKLPVVSSGDEEQGPDSYSKFLSGRHIVSKIRHMFNVQGRSTISYHMSLELIRPAYGEAVIS